MSAKKPTARITNREFKRTLKTQGDFRAAHAKIHTGIARSPAFPYRMERADDDSFRNIAGRFGLVIQVKRVQIFAYAGVINTQKLVAGGGYMSGLYWVMNFA
ncbi:MAG: hypothetical protein LBK41_03160 [Clostridiales bacterium]|jgi:hypothetical protein|nr:hypothetical protein [Clostridiales bacterium]